MSTTKLKKHGKIFGSLKAHLLIVVYFCCFFSSCTFLQNVRLLIGGEIKRENYVQEIPFEWRKDLIVVKARLNSDTTQREFIFDTGAFNSKIESDLATELNLKTVTEKTNSTAQGISQNIEVTRLDSLKLGETTFYNIGAGKLSYAPNSASPCIAANGIIGANLIKLAHWKIDYEKQVMYFSDEAFEVEEGSYVLSFEHPLLSGTPEIDIEIEGKKAQNIIFDVGYNGSLILPLSIAEEFDEIESEIILDQSTSGIYGTNADSLLIKSLAINVGGTKAQMPVRFSKLNKALLGNAFLKHFLVVINYENTKIYLQKKKDVNIASLQNFSVAIKNDSLWMVSRTSPTLPLKLGETLLSVNGKKPLEFFTSHCDYVMNIQRLIEQDSLTIQRMDGSFYTYTKD